ncbi:GNAT family N-acetyltransferase [Paenibacillus campi]|uniref:GNAT family N-acetyltransferase n=1 Tax=Paenibacillus campi TaxID=3106031 RepID=UPI002AFFE927|nr:MULTISPECIES: GNAT family N-acetyltransferase [unclassified Paenibacillus]
MLNLTEATPNDEPFLFAVYRSTKIDEFLLMNVAEEQLHMLMHMQFRAQQLSYRSQYPSACHRIIQIGNKQAGYMITYYENEQVRLVFIALLPEFRNQGYGTLVLNQLQQTAHTVSLQVAQHNPARQWYHRQGFTECAYAPPYVTMQWQRS